MFYYVVELKNLHSFRKATIVFAKSLRGAKSWASHGLVMVWYEGICPDDMDDTPEKMTKAQIDTIKKLVEARLVSGASYE